MLTTLVPGDSVPVYNADSYVRYCSVTHSGQLFYNMLEAITVEIGKGEGRRALILFPSLS